MNILHVVPAFYPATYWGGPTFSTYYLCNALALQPGVRLAVLTTDSAGPERRQRVPVASVPMKYPGGYDVYFCRRNWGASFSVGMLARLWTMTRWADVIHVTAAYSPSTIPALLVARLLHKPVVWSPRGALQRWERTTRAGLKAAWDAVCSHLLDASRTVLHVTSTTEAEESAQIIRIAPCHTIPNGVEIPDERPGRAWRPGGVTRLLFIGRLDAKKGIENLLSAVKYTPRDATRLTICGSGEAAYREELLSLVSSLELTERVRFLGHVDGHAKAAAFMEADVCVIPSFTENFGMVVAEALAHGVPVIASRGTPWAAVEEHHCGLWVDNKPEALRAAIASLDGADLEAMGKRGRMWMQKDFAWSAVAGQMHSLYTRLAEGSS